MISQLFPAAVSEPLMAEAKVQNSELHSFWAQRRWMSLLSALSLSLSACAQGILQIDHGYFWDPTTAEYFIPRGFGYQTWNPDVGADQSFAQLDYDLIEFKKMYANSVRAEFVWNVVE